MSMPTSLEMVQLVDAVQSQRAATLVAAIVTAAGRPYSIAEVLEIERDVYLALYPQEGRGRYEEWAKTKDDRLAKVRM